MPTPKENIVADFAAVCAQIVEIQLRPSYTVDNVTVDRTGLLRDLRATRAQMLKDYPGIDAELQPVFEIHVRPDGCY